MKSLLGRPHRHPSAPQREGVIRRFEGERGHLLRQYHGDTRFADEFPDEVVDLGHDDRREIVSPYILHKTDIGGVALDINGDEAVREAQWGVVLVVSRAVQRWSTSLKWRTRGTRRISGHSFWTAFPRQLKLFNRNLQGATMASPFALRANLHALFDSSRQNNVDLLRALAITAVLIHHGQHVFGGNVPFFGANGGWFGVQLFFVISGYLISASCEKNGLRDYAIHRFFRIVPAYLFFFLAIGIRAKVVTAGAIAADPWAFVVNLAFLQHLFPSALVKFDVLHVSWTLTVEVLWYVLAPLLLLGKRTLGWPTVLITLLVSTAWSYTASIGALDSLYPGETDVNPGYAYLFVVNHFFAQAIFFVFGAWIHFHRRAVTQINPVLALGLSIFIFLAQPYYLIFNPMFVTGVGISLLLVTAVNSQTIRSRLVFLVSETSYAIYLCHFPVMLWVRHHLEMDGLAGASFSVALTLLLASLSYILIEKPFVKVGRLLTRPSPLVLLRLDEIHRSEAAAMPSLNRK